MVTPPYIEVPLLQAMVNMCCLFNNMHTRFIFTDYKPSFQSFTNGYPTASHDGWNPGSLFIYVVHCVLLWTSSFLYI